MTTAQTIPTTYPVKAWGGVRRVAKLPVEGYTHRWEAQAYGDPTGSRPQVFPSTIDAAHDMNIEGTATFATRWALERTAGPVLHAPTGGKMLSYVSDVNTIASPITVVAVGCPDSTDGAFFSWVDLTYWNGSATIRMNMHVSDQRLAIQLGTPAIITPTNLVAGENICAAFVINGASSFITVNGAKTTGTLPTGAIPFRNIRMGVQSGGATPDTKIGAIVIYPRALTDQEIAQITAYYAPIYDIA